MAHTFGSVVGEGEEEIDDDSDYEEEPTLGFTETKINDSAQEGRVPRHKFLPGAWTT